MYSPRVGRGHCSVGMDLPKAKKAQKPRGKLQTPQTVALAPHLNATLRDPFLLDFLLIEVDLEGEDSDFGVRKIWAESIASYSISPNHI